MGFNPVTRVRVDDGLVEVLVTTVVQVVEDQLFRQAAQFAAVHRVRQVTDLVNLGQCLISQVHLIKLGGGGIAIIESLVSIGDGGHGCFVWVISETGREVWG